MVWLAPRVLLTMLAALTGGWLGEWLAGQWELPAIPVALMGATLGVGLFVARDAWRGSRLSAWLSRPEGGAPVRSLGLWGDVAVRAERALRSRERDTAHERERLAQFFQAIEASPNGVVLLDAGDHVTWCSRVAAEYLGLQVERDLLQRITNLVRAPAFVHLLADSRSEQAVVIPSPQGNGQLSLLLRRYGTEGQRLLLVQDVTARERQEAMRRDFVANVSHEIRTPLTVLSGFVETMNTLPLTETERGRVLTLMAQQTQRMQTLVGDLLTLARLEGSPRPAVDDWVPLARMAQAVEVEAQGLSAGHHTLSFDWGEPLEVGGAEPELASALANLVNNAVRYTPAGGDVRIKAHRAHDGALHIAVTDTGPGIAAEHLPRLTERFYRVDSSRSRETGGTGLGLSIVKHVAQRHGGELRIDSELGQGSTFTFVLPPARLRATTPR